MTFRLNYISVQFVFGLMTFSVESGFGQTTFCYFVFRSNAQKFIFARNFDNFSGFGSTETSYGFDFPKFRSQKIPESTPEVSVGQKFFFLQNEQLWFENTKLRFSKKPSFGSKTRSFGSKILKYWFENPKFHSKTRSFGLKTRSFG
jgi:hypothetical protein